MYGRKLDCHSMPLQQPPAPSVTAPSTLTSWASGRKVTLATWNQHILQLPHNKKWKGRELQSNIQYKPLTSLLKKKNNHNCWDILFYSVIHIAACCSYITSTSFGAFGLYTVLWNINSVSPLCIKNLHMGTFNGNYLKILKYLHFNYFILYILFTSL